MDFAKKILNRYGWKDGNGLGKNMDGMVKPLKANLKFDNAGFGADQAASDFNNHWWERVFNEATNNIEIKAKDDGVCMDLKNCDETVDITTKGYSVNKLKKLKDRKDNAKYENFLQSAVLTDKGNEVENSKEIRIDDIEVKKFKQLTDEELFKACGGRTAHKGARHGLNLSGKLARLEMQEQEMLASILAKRKEAVVKTIADERKNPIEENEFASEVKGKSKKRNKSSKDSVQSSEENKNEGRKKKKKTTENDEIIEDQMHGEETKATFRVEEESVPSVKIQHTKIRKHKAAAKNNVIHLNAESVEETTTCIENGDNIVEESVMNTVATKNKKCKKNKKDRKKMVVEPQDQEMKESIDSSRGQEGNVSDGVQKKSTGSKNDARKSKEETTDGAEEGPHNARIKSKKKRKSSQH